MRSITKRDLTRDEIQAVIRAAFGDAVEIREVAEFTDGWFAAVYGVTLADGREAVLKASPPSDLRMLRYEVDLAHTEIEFYRRAAEAGVPVPAMHYCDPEGGYLVVDRLPGVSLRTVKDTMSASAQRAVRHQLGALAARINTVTGPRFGYPRRDGHTWSDSWRTSFLTFLDDILADAAEYRRELPAPVATIEKLVHRHADVLDEVSVPALVHFDLWDGNVFVHPDGDGYAIAGIIDGERAFYGDPIAEFVAFGDPEHVPGLLAGYFGEARPLTPGERLRWQLYTVYVDLIMLTEGAVRGFDPAEHDEIRRWVFARLDRTLASLAT